MVLLFDMRISTSLIPPFQCLIMPYILQAVSKYGITFRQF